LANQIIDGVDLPRIIRESTTGVAAEVMTAGIVSPGVAAVIDLVVAGALVGVRYVGVALTRLMVQPSAFRLPAPSVVVYARRI
jgi:hypothetical protein